MMLALFSCKIYNTITRVNRLNSANRVATSVYIRRFHQFTCFYECGWGGVECGQAEQKRESCYIKMIK